MPAISSLTRQVPVTTTVDIEAEQVTVTFDRNALTPYRLNQMQVALEAGDLMASANMLADLIISWDITDERGPYEPSAQNIGRLPINVLSVITQRISEASVPGEAEGNASQPSVPGPPSATSKPDLPSSPNGSDGSTSPKSLESVSSS